MCALLPPKKRLPARSSLAPLMIVRVRSRIHPYLQVRLTSRYLFPTTTFANLTVRLSCRTSQILLWSERTIAFYDLYSTRLCCITDYWKLKPKQDTHYWISFQESMIIMLTNVVFIHLCDFFDTLSATSACYKWSHLNQASLSFVLRINQGASHCRKQNTLLITHLL